MPIKFNYRWSTLYTSKSKIQLGGIKTLHEAGSVGKTPGLELYSPVLVQYMWVDVVELCY